MRTRGAPTSRSLAHALATLAVVVTATATAATLATTLAIAATAPGQIGPQLKITGNGRALHPLGRLTRVGNFPTGSALSPDGRFLWVVDSGHGSDDVRVVNVKTGRVAQILPLPGAYGGIAFAPDGRRAYVSGTPKGDSPTEGPTKGNQGDVVHVFAVDSRNGKATEQTPIALPSTSGGSGRLNSLPPVSGGGSAYPEGLAVSPDRRTLVVALNQADRAAVIDIASGAGVALRTGRYPAGVAFDRRGRAYVSNEYDGTLTVIDAEHRSVIATIAGLGGSLGDHNSHPEGIAADPTRDAIYVAVTNRDLVATVDTGTLAVTHVVSVGRPEALGTAPVSLAVAPDGRTLYAADAGEDAVAVISLARRPGGRAASRRGYIPRLPAGVVIGKIPTAAYPTSVQITRSGSRLLWIAGKGFGAGANSDYYFGGDKRPTVTPKNTYGTYVLDKLLGIVGVLPTPTDVRARRSTREADRQAIPANAEQPPPGTPVAGPDGGPSRQIKHVFLIVRENRTYDQVFGSDPRGDGAPSLELFDDNGVAGPTGGVTPNAHKLAHMFPLLDHVYSDSEVSVDGHLITSGGYATDYVQRALAANYSGRSKGMDFGIYPVTFPPRYFLFDQAASQGISFMNYGEEGAGNSPFGSDGRSTFSSVAAHTDTAYPNNLFIGCLRPAGPVGDLAACTQDSGIVNGKGGIQSIQSRVTQFQLMFNAQAATGSVPTFNYMIMPNDHTSGTTPGAYTPQAMIADNDLALGQIVDLISHSPIWPSTAIFVVEDDSQDGADHIDAHRQPAFVISPWAKRGAVVHTRYDQYSAIHTAELIAGIQPLSLNDALATPMYDAFDTTADVNGTRYTQVIPTQPLNQLNTASTPSARLSAQMPWGRLDAVPQAVSDQILWKAVHGDGSKPPPPGPNPSPIEHARGLQWLKAIAHHLGLVGLLGGNG